MGLCLCVRRQCRGDEEREGERERNSLPTKKCGNEIFENYQKKICRDDLIKKRLRFCRSQLNIYSSIDVDQFYDVVKAFDKCLDKLLRLLIYVHMAVIKNVWLQNVILQNKSLQNILH